MYDFDKLVGYKNFSVLVRSLEQFKKLMLELEQRSCLWLSGDCPTDLIDLWDDHGKNTIVNIYKDKRLTYESKSSYNRRSVQSDDDYMLFDYCDLDFNDSDKKISFEEIY